MGSASVLAMYGCLVSEVNCRKEAVLLFCDSQSQWAQFQKTSI